MNTIYYIYIYIYIQIYHKYIYTIYTLNIHLLIYINYITVICLEYSIILATENIYIRTVSNSRHNNHKAMYSFIFFKCFIFIFTLNFRHDKHVYKFMHIFKKS